MSHGSSFALNLAEPALHQRSALNEHTQIFFSLLAVDAGDIPALGYDAAQLAALQQTLDDCDADLIVSGTPLDLERLIPLKKRVVRARYSHADMDEPGLAEVLEWFLVDHPLEEDAGALLQ